MRQGKIVATERDHVPGHEVVDIIGNVYAKKIRGFSEPRNKCINESMN